MFSFVLLLGGVSLGVLGNILVQRVSRRVAARSLYKGLFMGFKTPTTVRDTGGVPIHELDNVDTAELRLDGIQAWRTR